MRTTTATHPYMVNTGLDHDVVHAAIAHQKHIPQSIWTQQSEHSVRARERERERTGGICALFLFYEWDEVTSIDTNSKSLNSPERRSG